MELTTISVSLHFTFIEPSDVNKYVVFNVDHHLFLFLYVCFFFDFFFPGVKSHSLYMLWIVSCDCLCLVMAYDCKKSEASVWSPHLQKHCSRVSLTQACSSWLAPGSQSCLGMGYLLLQIAKLSRLSCSSTARITDWYFRGLFFYSPVRAMFLLLLFPRVKLMVR